MLWILIWLAITPAGDMQYYHIGTYLTVEDCGKELSQAHILVKNKGQGIDCVPIELDESYIKLTPSK